ncbi:MAG: 50S ribosomal protein L10 [Nitrospinae bacterium]|nr:50S ribosomal protein L10 [Nitrospinota bacterium]
MNEIKVTLINELHDKFLRAKGGILSDYRGLNVQQITELRNNLREVSVEFKVIKNTLARRASKDTQFESIIDSFIGPTSIAISYDDVIAPAKVLIPFAKREPKLKITAGIIQGRAVTPEEIVTLSELPSREELLSRVLCGLQSPLTNLVGGLQGILRRFLYTLKAIEEKRS